jgi:hypothetical protein
MKTDFRSKARRSIRGAVIALLDFFLYAIVVPPFAQASLWEDRREAVETLQGSTRTSPDALPDLPSPDFSSGDPQIPEEWGSVVESRPGSAEGMPLALLIEDAHGIYGAQKNAASILRQIESAPDRKKTPLLVCVEGAWDRVNPEWLGALPEDAVKSRTAEILLRQGVLQGEEYLSVVLGPGRIEIQGVEDREVYLANLKSRTILEADRKKLLARLSALESRMQAVKRADYGRKLLELDAASRQFEDQKIALKDYVRYLMPLVPASSRGPQMRLLSELAALEDKKSSRTLETERRKLLEFLAGRLNPSAMDRLLQASLQFRLGKLSALTYNDGLVRLAELHEFPVPAIRAYAEYLKKVKTLDGRALDQEIRQIEREARAELTGGDPGFESLAEEDRELRIQRRFWSERFSPEDWEEYRRSGGFENGNNRIREIERFVAVREKRLGLKPAPANAERPRLSYAQMRFLQESYYELAFRRNEILASRAMEAAGRFGQDRFVLIAGGFHTRGIKEILARKGFPYCVIRPSLKPPEEHLFETADLKPSGFDRDRFASLMRGYEERLRTGQSDRRMRGPMSRALDLFQNRISFLPPVGKEGKIYLPGFFRGDRGQVRFAVEFSGRKDERNFVSAEFQNAVQASMGTLRAMSLLGPATLPETAPVAILQEAGLMLESSRVDGRQTRAAILTGDRLPAIGPGDYRDSPLTGQEEARLSAWRKETVRSQSPPPAQDLKESGGAQLKNETLRPAAPARRFLSPVSRTTLRNILRYGPLAAIAVAAAAFYVLGLGENGASAALAGMAAVIPPTSSDDGAGGDDDEHKRILRHIQTRVEEGKAHELNPFNDTLPLTETLIESVLKGEPVILKLDPEMKGSYKGLAMAFNWLGQYFSQRLSFKKTPKPSPLEPVTSLSEMSDGDKFGFVFKEMLKNAFSHGNKLNPGEPILFYIHLVEGKAVGLYVFDKAADPRQSPADWNKVKRTGIPWIFGENRGVRNIERTGWTFHELEDIAQGPLQGTLARATFEYEDPAAAPKNHHLLENLAAAFIGTAGVGLGLWLSPSSWIAGLALIAFSGFLSAVLTRDFLAVALGRTISVLFKGEIDPLRKRDLSSRFRDAGFSSVEFPDSEPGEGTGRTMGFWVSARTDGGPTVELQEWLTLRFRNPAVDFIFHRLLMIPLVWPLLARHEGLRRRLSAVPLLRRFPFLRTPAVYVLKPFLPGLQAKISPPAENALETIEQISGVPLPPKASGLEGAGNAGLSPTVSAVMRGQGADAPSPRYHLLCTSAKHPLTDAEILAVAKNMRDGDRLGLILDDDLTAQDRAAIQEGLREKLGVTVYGVYGSPEEASEEILRARRLKTDAFLQTASFNLFTNRDREELLGESPGWKTLLGLSGLKVIVLKWAEVGTAVSLSATAPEVEKIAREMGMEPEDLAPYFKEGRLNLPAKNLTADAAEQASRAIQDWLVYVVQQ